MLSEQTREGVTSPPEFFGKGAERQRQGVGRRCRSETGTGRDLCSRHGIAGDQGGERGHRGRCQKHREVQGDRKAPTKQGLQELHHVLATAASPRKYEGGDARSKRSGEVHQGKV